MCVCVLVEAGRSWQSADEGGQVEAELSNTETLHQAASVTVVSGHSRRSGREGNEGRGAILQHNAPLFIQCSTHRPFSWDVTLRFDKDIELHSAQL